MKINIFVSTIYDVTNFGNRLQNYALVNYLNNYNEVNCITNIVIDKLILKLAKRFIRKFIPLTKFERVHRFEKFSRYIPHKYNVKYNKNDYLIVGSDQVWNPNFAAKDYELFVGTKNNNKISYAASFGTNTLPDKQKDRFKKALDEFKYLSVREDAGKKIIEDLIDRRDVEVLIDPTMLLTSDEWDKVSKQPKHYKGEKYILNYFLGNLSVERKNAINKIAKDNNCKVINILDENDPYYVSGPSEFLWLEKNAFLICTDSFHSSVFAILYNRPFVIFDREEEGMNTMGSRIDTLLSKFNLKDRRYNGKEITKENLNYDYTEAYKILGEERKKSDRFLRKALDIEQ